ncbi:MAG: histidine phosphatase family protein [Nocardioidaceae bacterium]
MRHPLVEPVDTPAVEPSPGRRLILLRHGRTAWNRIERGQGHADVELDDLGHAQAVAAAAYLALLSPTGLWSSDLARTRQTCAYLEKETGLVATYDARLREFDLGARTGLTIAEFAECYPVEHAAWARHDDSVRLPGAETTAEVAARIVPALGDVLAALDPGQTGIVVTHGAALKVGLAVLLGWNVEAERSVAGMDNCAWASLAESEYAGRLRLHGYNESVRPGHVTPLVLPDES